MARKPPSIDLTEPRHWHVTLTLAGAAQPVSDIKESLEQLSEQHAFLLSARYAADCAEVAYWDEDEDLQGAAKRALSLWHDYTDLASLPPWEVIGLEVVDRATHQARAPRLLRGRRSRGLSAVGANLVRPF
jgi:hypothetical protein